MVEPCSDAGAYRAEPTEDTRLDLEKFEDVLKENDYGIEFSSEVIVLVRHDETDVEVGIYPSGKLLFKTTDKDVVDELFDEFSEMVANFIKN